MTTAVSTAPLYCTTTDLVNRMSAEGVQYRIDDDPPTALGDVLAEAADTVDEHCWTMYSQAALAGSSWIKERCADIAAYLLCERRGNPVPPGIAQKHDRTLKKLERVQLGLLQVPFLAVLRTAVPIMSQPRIRLDPFPRVVIEKSRSTGKVEGPQDADTLDFAFVYQI